MSYIGISPAYGNYEKDTLLGNGVDTTFQLRFAVATPSQLLVSLGGVIQEPDYSYSVNMVAGNSQIVFSNPPPNNMRIFIVYMGKQLLTASTATPSPHLDVFSGDNSTTQFTLTRVPYSNDDFNFLVFVNNVFQRYTDSYTVSGSTLTFTTAPSSGINNIQVFQLSVVNSYFGIPDNYITTLKLQNNSVTTDKINDDSVTTDKINDTIALNPNGTGGVSISDFTFPTSDGAADQLLVTDGNGTLTWRDAAVAAEEYTYTNANTSATIELDFSLGTCFIVDKNTYTSSSILLGSNPLSGFTYTVIVISNGSSYSFGNSNLSWPNNSAPVPTSTANKKDIYSFVYAGGFWYGTYAFNFT